MFTGAQSAGLDARIIIKGTEMMSVILSNEEAAPAGRGYV
jgi:hypothetical protein